SPPPRCRTSACTWPPTWPAASRPGSGPACRCALSQPRATSSGRVAIRVAGRVAAFQPDLVHPATTEDVAFQEEPFVEADPAGRADVQLGHPGTHPVGVKLLVPRSVQRVGEVHPRAVPA